MSQEELADRASLDRTYISSIERCLRNISFQNIQRLAVALQVDPRELLDLALESDTRYGGASAQQSWALLFGLRESCSARE